VTESDEGLSHEKISFHILLFGHCKLPHKWGVLSSISAFQIALVVMKLIKIISGSPLSHLVPSLSKSSHNICSFLTKSIPARSLQNS
jgi:hypothetical protein